MQTKELNLSTTQNNVRHRLKSETAEAHQRLDAMMSARGPFDSAHNYHWYLTGMHALHRHCQESILWVESELELEPRKIELCELIESDLATLGEPVSLIAENEIPQSAAQSELDIASRWAQAYVMEGSAIGASFMIRGAKSKLPADTGCAYLTQLASDAKQRWPKFVAGLALADVDGDAAVVAASRVFENACEIFS
jgi:heme oxygenase